jgi:hypothetical protein
MGWVRWLKPIRGVPSVKNPDSVITERPIATESTTGTVKGDVTQAPITTTLLCSSNGR